MKPSELVKPLAGIYERHGWQATAEGQSFYVGRLEVYKMTEHRSCIRKNGTYEEIHFHRLDGKPSFIGRHSDYISWDVGGLTFYKQSRDGTPKSLRGENTRYNVHSLAESDYNDAVAGWYEFAGRDWIKRLMSNEPWSYMWLDFCRMRRWRFE